MPTFEIKNRYNGTVIYSGEGDSLGAIVEGGNTIIRNATYKLTLISISGFAYLPYRNGEVMVSYWECLEHLKVLL